MRPFVRDGDLLTAVLEPEETEILRELSEQIMAFLGERDGRAADPALRRLLPDAYRDDPESASDFRRFTEDALVERKIANAEVLLATLQQAESTAGSRIVRLDARGSAAWMRTLADHRLILAERLGIVDERTSLRRADQQLVALYDWLAFVQDSLVRALDSPH